MINRPLTKLKISTKRLLGRCVYSYIYLKNKTKKFFIAPHKKNRSSKSKSNVVVLAIEQWRISTLIFILFIAIYYGGGAFISSNINKRLNNHSITSVANGKKTFSSLAYVLKSQVDNVAWTPALPVIFPAAVLDNLPNFQLGVKESTEYFIKKLANHYKNNSLKEIGELLDYPADIWLFSQTKEDKLTPGSAKQYRKALANLKEFIEKENITITDKDFIYILKNIIELLNKQITILNKHAQEHSSELLDISADNIFYKTQGNVYTIHYLLSAVTHDCQNQILKTEQYENITTALKFLTDAEELNPLTIKNASTNNSYEANHLLYLAYYLAQAQNYLIEVYYINLMAQQQAEQSNEN
jgi:hypothetical protein